MLSFGASVWLPKSQLLDVERAQRLENLHKVELSEWELGSLLPSSSSGDHSSLILWSVRTITSLVWFRDVESSILCFWAFDRAV